VSLQVAVASDAKLLPCVLPINGPASALPTKTFGRYFMDDVIVDPLKVEDGAVVVSDKPGLGIEGRETESVLYPRTNDRRSSRLSTEHPFISSFLLTTSLSTRTNNSGPNRGHPLAGRSWTAHEPA
jgi:hypothetical protein